MADTERALYANAKSAQFPATDLPRLAARLTRLDEHTLVRSITRVEDLDLLPNGLTRDGYRYTAIGFLQVAYELSPGLSTLVPDIAGCSRRPEQEAEQFDLGAAIGIFNTTLSLRFNQLRGHRLVCDTRKKQIEGLVGPKRQYLKNSEMLQAIDDAIHGVRGVSFHGAEIIGRRLTLWYRKAEPVLQLKCRDQTHPIWTGFYFCNSEAAGTGLRGTDILFNRHGCCLGPFRAGTRMAHVGKTFRKRAERLFGKVIDREPNAERIRKGLRELVNTPLQVIGDPEARDQHKLRLTHMLARSKKVSAWLAKDVVENALMVGADNEALGPMQLVHPQPYANRSAYDLFCALIRRSRNLNLERREGLEQAAYELMLGRIKLGDR